MAIYMQLTPTQRWRIIEFMAKFLEFLVKILEFFGQNPLVSVKILEFIVFLLLMVHENMLERGAKYFKSKNGILKQVKPYLKKYLQPGKIRVSGF